MNFGMPACFYLQAKNVANFVFLSKPDIFNEEFAQLLPLLWIATLVKHI